MAEHVEVFKDEYKKLNKAQKEAVDTIEGPVMVVAGPGTGKTQILALRIGNILLKTDTKPDGILSLTFTNSGVRAMKERLRAYIGPTGSRVHVFTFHSFGMKIIEEYYSLLDLDAAPTLMDEIDAVVLSDQILQDNIWKYLRPRSDTSLYFRDLKSLISLLKRERLSPEDFLKAVNKDIKSLKEDENNISTRGDSKGQIKKEVLKKIESLERTSEVVEFYKLYEKAKTERNVFDYDDVLENLVKITEVGDEVCLEIREKYLYVLIDEHQDSSGVQNEFLRKVWGNVEKPNIFVVGDDRQLIYGFGGASLAYFEGFKHSFGKAKLITLIDNYRSTQVILDSAHVLLESSITSGKLKSKNKEQHPLGLVEADYPRDEIIACALDIKKKISGSAPGGKRGKKGVDVNDCAILVPKNKQVRSTVTILRDMGLPVSSYGTLNLFDQDETEIFLRVLKIISDPYDNVSLAQSFFDFTSGISPLAAHQFIKEHDMRKFSLADLVGQETPTLFETENAVNDWIGKLSGWLEKSQTLSIYSLIQLVGSELLLDEAEDHRTLIARIEIVRTVLHLALGAIDKPARTIPARTILSGGNPKMTLKEFLFMVDRLESYKENIPLAVYSADQGVKVLTLHSSKGLEFDYVWIAHMDQRSLISTKRNGFALPENILKLEEETSEEVAKRQLYVAITRAKRFSTISYSRHSYTGVDQELAHIVADLPGDLFKKQNSAETEKIILDASPHAYIAGPDTRSIKKGNIKIKELTKIVSKEYEKRNVSVSLLNNFFECTWKWYFRNLLKLPEAKSESLEFGSAVHECIDHVLKLKKTPTVKEVEAIVKREVSKIKLGNDKLQGQRHKEILSVVSRWVKNSLPLVEPKHENEKSVSAKDDKFPHLNIYGRIDLVEYLPGNVLRVTDFKTGGVRKKGEIEKIDDEGRMSSYLRQLAMYSYLLTQSSNLNIKESRLEFVEAKDKKESIYSRVITTEEIDLLKKDITDYDNLVKTGKWVTRVCNYKSYGKDTQCEYCKRAEIYNL